MRQRIGAAVGQSREQVQRRARKLARPMRIARGHREYSERREVARSSLPQNQQDLAKLRTQGFVEVSLAEELRAELISTSREKLASAESLPQRGKKAFFSQLLSAEDRELDSVYMRVALNEEMLRMVGAYLGGAPFLESVELLLSKPLTDDGPARSQLWHRDRTDTAILKLFVYINDVEEQNGPFVFITKDESKKVPEYLPHYVPDLRMEHYVPLSRAVRVNGEAGTAFLVDSTNCYHLGSRCQEPRLAYVAYYSSGFGYFPRETEWDIAAQEQDALSKRQRLALGQFPG